MKTNAKKQFKRFESFYKKGELQLQFIKRLKDTYEISSNGELGVVQSYFDYCEEKYGRIEQTKGGAYDILADK